MTNNIKNVCVFSSSSNALDEIYYKDAQELGFLLGKSGFTLIYGGGATGTMGVNAKAAKNAGGKVIGVIPEKLHALVEQNKSCDELHITKGMRDRKQKLDELSDAVITLAGGFGTLEELSEMITQKQLGYSGKAIVILNTAGFYDNLLKFFEEIIDKKFAGQNSSKFYYVAKTPQDAIEYLTHYVPEYFDISTKYTKKESGKV